MPRTDKASRVVIAAPPEKIYAALVEARFVSLEPGGRVVEDIDFASDAVAFAGTMTMTWELRVIDDRTLVEITADNVPDGIAAVDHATGMSSSLANLARYMDT